MNENSVIVGRDISDKDMNASDKEIKRTLIAFEENAKVADTDSIREHYGSKFVAVWKREVIGDDPDLDSLLQKIDGHDMDPETYIGYISKKM